MCLNRTAKIVSEISDSHTDNRIMNDERSTRAEPEPTNELKRARARIGKDKKTPPVAAGFSECCSNNRSGYFFFFGWHLPQVVGAFESLCSFLKAL